MLFAGPVSEVSSLVSGGEWSLRVVACIEQPVIAAKHEEDTIPPWKEEERGRASKSKDIDGRRDGGEK